MKDNIIFKCYYYKPKEKYNSSFCQDKIKKRDFVSCNSSYNYVSYIDTGASNNLPQDFAEYIGNKEKSCGAFNQDGLLNDKQKKELKEMLRTTQSCIWDCVISFREEFGNKYCRDYEQAYNFVKSELPKFFTRAGLNKDNIIWYAGLHENTDNKHIHISFFEKEPQYFQNGGKLCYHNGTISKKVLIDSKRIFEQKLTCATNEIISARKDLYEKYDVSLSPQQLTKKIKNMLIDLFEQLPKEGRISYDSENMEMLKDSVDDITSYILYHNKQTQKSYYYFERKLDELHSWQRERDYYESESYRTDLYRRLGNITIQKAIEVGRINERLKRLQVHTSQQGYYKKLQRKKLIDQILDLMEYSAKMDQEAIEAFERYFNKLEYLRKRREYESEYEM